MVYTTKTDNSVQDELYISQNVKIKNTIPFDVLMVGVSSKIVSWKAAVYWNLISFFSARAYVVYDDATLVHYSLVTHSKYKFKFMSKGDIHIGPCWTNPDYRGRGIYPAVLSHILTHELKGDSTAYMIINSLNKPSKAGVAKAGFKKTGDIVHRDSIGRYYI